MVNILLYVAEQCKLYYPATETEAMLSTFLALMTRDVRAWYNYLFTRSNNGI